MPTQAIYNPSNDAPPVFQTILISAKLIKPYHIQSLYYRTDFKAKVPTTHTKKKLSRSAETRYAKGKKGKDAGMSNGGEVTKHCVPPMFCSSSRSKSTHTQAACAKTPKQKGNKNLQAAVTQRTFRSAWEVSKTSSSDHLRQLRCQKNCTPL